MLPTTAWQASALVASCLLLSLALTWVAMALARRFGIMDVPNQRSSHRKPTPRAGGAGMAVAFWACLAAWSAFGGLEGRVALAVLGPGALLAVVGLADDIRSLPVAPRLAAQALAAAMAIVLLASGGPPTGLPAGWVLAALCGVGLVWAANLFNFMDGIDGMAASEAAFVAGAGSALLLGPAPGLAVASALLAAACVGFLAWNWPPARVFMGDCGSGFLGLTLAVMAAASAGSVPPQAWAILGGVFIVDATVTLVTRLARGYRPHEAHRSHAYQVLARRWAGHRPVVGCLWLVNACWLLPWALAAASRPETANAALAAALSPLCVLAVWLGAGRSVEAKG